MNKFTPFFCKIIFVLVLFITIKATAQPVPANFYSPKVDFTTGNTPNDIAIGDVDGDGKPDLVVVNLGSNTISILRNISTLGSSISASSFAAKVDFAAGNQPYWVGIVDVDGDGKPDLLVANSGSNTISVLRNTSTSGSITFAAKVDFATGSRPLLCSIADVDGDGKPDLVVANFNSNTISVLRNTSTLGSISASSFAAKVDFATGGSPSSVAIRDLDGDGKPDLVITNYSSFTISVFHNTSTLGSINASSFEAKVDFGAGSSPYNVAIDDLDGDGRPDLVVLNSGLNNISVYRNTSTLGSISASSFAAEVIFTVGNHPVGVAISDVDGDGKLDLVIANQIDYDISVLRNTSTPGSISASSFSTPTNFNSGGQPVGVAIADLNGDGIPEIATSNYDANTVSVFQKAIPLSLTCPQNIIASGCNNTTYTVSATDDCTSIPTLTYSFSGATTGSGNGTGSGSLFLIGTTYVTVTATDACGNSATCTFTVTVNSNLSVSCSNNNAALYFGYPGDQTATVTGTPNGGVGPYNVSITMDRALMCNVITSSGNEIWTGGAGTSSNSNTTCPTLGVPPISTANSIATGGSYSVTATLMADAVFTITVTDALGCTATCTSKIHSEDVRCFAGNSGISKVTLCHQTGSAKNPCTTICVDSSEVQAHLDHGDFLGNCTANCLPPPPALSSTGAQGSITTETTEGIVFDVKGLPNPSGNRFTLKVESDNINEKMTVRVVDVLGKVVEVRNNIFAGQTLQIGNNYRPGVYFVEITQGNNKKQLKLIKL